MTYVVVLKAKLVHALVASSTSEEAWTIEHVKKTYRVEPELIAVIVNLSKFIAINPICVIPSEKLA